MSSEVMTYLRDREESPPSGSEGIKEGKNYILLVPYGVPFLCQDTYTRQT